MKQYPQLSNLHKQTHNRRWFNRKANEKHHCDYGYTCQNLTLSNFKISKIKASTSHNINLQTNFEVHLQEHHNQGIDTAAFHILKCLKIIEWGIF